MNARAFCHPLFLAALLALFSSGCLEHEVKTIVHADGSCDRVIILNPGTKSVPDTPFPLPTDNTWDTTWAKADSGKTEYVCTMKKHFETLDALEKEYGQAPSSGKIEVRVRVQKKFRWFYTYFVYQESYGRHTNYTLVPPSAVMTEEEIQRFTYGDTSRTLKNKKDEWAARNLFEVLHRSIVRGAQAHGDSTLTPEILSVHKEEFFRTLAGYTAPGEPLIDPSKNPALTAYHGLQELFKQDSTTEAGIEGLIELAGHAYGSSSVGRIRDSIRAGWEGVRNLLEFKEEHGEKFTSSVDLPGVLLETNASKVEGNSAGWRFEIENLTLHDYEMHAESRLVNVWAIWVTGILVLLIFGVLFVPQLVKRRSASPF